MERLQLDRSQLTWSVSSGSLGKSCSRFLRLLARTMLLNFSAAKSSASAVWVVTTSSSSLRSGVRRAFAELLLISLLLESKV